MCRHELEATRVQQAAAEAGEFAAEHDRIAVSAQRVDVGWKFEIADALEARERFLDLFRMHRDGDGRHAEGGSARHDRLPDPAEPDEAQPGSAQLTHETAWTEEAVFPTAVAKRSVGLERVLAKRDEHADRVLRHGDLVTLAIANDHPF